MADRSRHPARLFAMAGLVLALLLTVGCSAIMESGMMRKKEQGLSQSSYGAADMLIQQSRSLITPETPLEVGALVDMDNPGEITSFGRIVAEQIASRFVQLGYNVTTEAQPGELPQALPQTSMPAPVFTMPRGDTYQSSRSVITGRYAVARDGVLVNLRIIEVDTGKVLAAFDYNVPKTRDVRELVKTQADRESFFDF